MSVRFASRAGKILSLIPTTNSLIFEVFLSISLRFSATASWVPAKSSSKPLTALPRHQCLYGLLQELVRYYL